MSYLCYVFSFVCMGAAVVRFHADRWVAGAFAFIGGAMWAYLAVVSA